MRGYDRWKTTPPEYPEPPDEIASLIGRQLWIDGERYRIEDAEPWTDTDEDGSRHDGWDLVVVTSHYGRQHGRNYSLDDIQAFLEDQTNHGPLELEEDGTP